MLRFGPMRAQLRGIEAVLADGTVVSHLAGLVKDNTGYDYPSLLARSKGTLAVITAARLRISAPEPHPDQARGHHVSMTDFLAGYVVPPGAGLADDPGLKASRTPRAQP